MTPLKQQKEPRPYAVNVRIIRECSFLVDARTEAEAEGIVEDYIEDGELGTINESEHEVLDVFVADGVEVPDERPMNRSLFPGFDPHNLEDSDAILD